MILRQAQHIKLRQMKLLPVRQCCQLREQVRCQTQVPISLLGVLQRDQATELSHTHAEGLCQSRGGSLTADSESTSSHKLSSAVSVAGLISFLSSTRLPALRPDLDCGYLHLLP